MWVSAFCDLWGYKKITAIYIYTCMKWETHRIITELISFLLTTTTTTTIPYICFFQNTAIFYCVFACTKLYSNSNNNNNNNERKKYYETRLNQRLVKVFLIHHYLLRLMVKICKFNGIHFASSTLFVLCARKRIKMKKKSFFCYAHDYNANQLNIWHRWGWYALQKKSNYSIVDRSTSFKLK